jgi:hypothetical protein
MSQAKYVNPNQQQTTQGAKLVLAHQLYGEKVDSHAITNASGANVQRQVQSVFSNYKPPARRQGDNPDKALCSAEGCNAFPSKRFAPYCPGHARSLGLAPKCDHAKCGAPPMGETKFCYYHQPTPRESSTEKEVTDGDTG